ncbi:MAG: hypothetical protein M1814_006631 [Vezdaea aestivalis]|nr:MAG: hypothetical protein M1814_006631 [Vezdaea aestivalis]
MSGKYSFTQSLKEVRFLFCQRSEQSAATRSFLARAYPTMKRNNPQTPIMIREASGTEPRVFARYEYGKEKQEPLSGENLPARLSPFSISSHHIPGLSDKEIEEKVSGLVKSGI